MRFLAAWAIVVGLVLGWPMRAHADTSGTAPALAMDEPRSGLHLEVEGACQVRPADGGGAACRDFAASADKSERFAVVLDAKGLLFYSVAIFAEPELGVGEARARRVSTSMGESIVGTPALSTYGDQRFLRAHLRTSAGAAICFITADDRPEVAIIMFATEPASFAAMEPRAEAAMRTLQRTKAAAAPTTPTTPTPMSAGSRALLTAFLVLLFGLPVFRFIRRAIRTARRRESGKPPADEPRRPR